MPTRSRQDEVRAYYASLEAHERVEVKLSGHSAR